MSGYRNINELLRPILDDPTRRARVEEEKRAMDAIITPPEKPAKRTEDDPSPEKRRYV